MVHIELNIFRVGDLFKNGFKKVLLSPKIQNISDLDTLIDIKLQLTSYCSYVQPKLSGLMR